MQCNAQALVATFEVESGAKKKGGGSREAALSREECDALFVQIDADGNGQLSLKEVKAGIKVIKSTSSLTRSAKKIFGAADASSDKMLDADEFYEYMSDATEALVDPNIAIGAAAAEAAIGAAAAAEAAEAAAKAVEEAAADAARIAFSTHPPRPRGPPVDYHEQTQIVVIKLNMLVSISSSKTQTGSNQGSNLNMLNMLV